MCNEKVDSQKIIVLIKFMYHNRVMSSMETSIMKLKN